MIAENILEEHLQSEISPSDLNDVNMYDPVNEIPSGTDKIFHDTSSVDDVDITPPQCVLPKLTSSTISSKKRKSCDEFSTFIKIILI